MTNQGVELLIHYIKRYGKVEVEEFLFDDNNCIVKDVDGNSHINEVIIPMFRHQIVNDFKTKEIITQRAKRKFPPYSEWLYFKIYCGPAFADKLLKNELLTFTNDGFSRRFI